VRSKKGGVHVCAVAARLIDPAVRTNIPEAVVSGGFFLFKPRFMNQHAFVHHLLWDDER
jgi:hypothetical protein